MLQKRIDKISKYFKSIELTNNTLIIKVMYEHKWGVFPSEDGKIKVAKSEDSDDVWFYYGKADEVSVDDIFDLIDNTIEMNLSAAAKLELLTKKFDELKELFATESLDRLQTLKFVISNRKKNKKHTENMIVDAKNNEEIKNNVDEQ